MANTEKHILILITKAETGGAQVSVFNLANKLKQKGYDVIVGFGKGTFLAEKLAAHDIPYHRFTHLIRTHNPISLIQFVWELRQYLKNNHITTIHFNSTNPLPGVLSCMGFKPKPTTVFTFRGLSLIDKNYKDGNSFLKTLYTWYFKFFLHLTDHCVLVSKENMDQIETMKLPSKKAVVYNGLDPKELHFLEQRDARSFFEKKIGVSLEGKLIIGSIGRLSYQKNYEFLIAHWERIQRAIPEAVLVIIGGGPDKAKLKEQMRSIGASADSIYLLGDIHDAHNYLRGFDFFILPSRYEGLSIVLLETLFAGTPVIATDVNSNAEVLGNAGLVYPLDDIDTLLSHVTALAKKETRETLSSRAKERSKLFDVEHTVNGYLELYG